MIETFISSLSTHKNIQIIQNATEYHSPNIEIAKNNIKIMRNTIIYFLILIIGSYLKYYFLKNINNIFYDSYIPGFVIIIAYNFIFIGIFGIFLFLIEYIYCNVYKDKNVHKVSIYYTVKKLSTQVLLFASSQLLAFSIKNDTYFDNKKNFFLTKENIGNFFTSISFIIGVFLSKSFIIGFLRYIVYNNHAKKRIESVNNKLKIISKILVISNASYSDDIKIIMEKIIQHLGNGNNYIERKSLQNYISQEDIDNLFFYTDRYDAKTIEGVHFSMFYHSTFYEQEHLANSLIQVAETLKKLNFISNIITIPILVAITLNGFNSDSSTAAKIGIVASGMLSGGYIFNSIIKNFLDSILFVFFIRPFEVNDFIKINNIIYKVKEINVFSSLLTTNKLRILFLNHNLLNLPIINFRTSQAIEVSYDYIFKTLEFKKKSKLFLQELEDFMNTKIILFKKKPYFKETKIISSEKINTKLICNFNLVKMNMRELNDNQEDLVIMINDIFNKIELIPFT